jgi:hypothetical protein
MASARRSFYYEVRCRVAASPPQYASLVRPASLHVVTHAAPVVSLVRTVHARFVRMATRSAQAEAYWADSRAAHRTKPAPMGLASQLVLPEKHPVEPNAALPDRRVRMDNARQAAQRVFPARYAATVDLVLQGLECQPAFPPGTCAVPVLATVHAKTTSHFAAQAKEQASAVPKALSAVRPSKTSFGAVL